MTVSEQTVLGLASFVAEQRTKEIGIQKVLGASIASLWGTLSSEFMILVGLQMRKYIALFVLYLGM